MVETQPELELWRVIGLWELLITLLFLNQYVPSSNSPPRRIGSAPSDVPYWRSRRCLWSAKSGAAAYRRAQCLRSIKSDAGLLSEQKVLHPGQRLGLKRLHQHQNLGRIDWKCSKYDVPHRTQIACLSDVIFQVSDHRDDGARALGLKNLHCSRMRVVRYKSLVLVSTISTVLRS